MFYHDPLKSIPKAAARAAAIRAVAEIEASYPDALEFHGRRHRVDLVEEDDLLVRDVGVDRHLVAGKVVVHEEAGQQPKPALDDVFRSHAVGRILHSVLEVLHQTGCSGFMSGSRIVARRRAVDFDRGFHRLRYSLCRNYKHRRRMAASR